MGHSLRSRPIYRTLTAGGAHYIPVDRYQDSLSIQVTAGGSTFTVDYTLDNIIRSQANSYDVHGEVLTAPASAEWTNLIASGAVDVALANQEIQAMAIRINITAFVGDVGVRITQST